VGSGKDGKEDVGRLGVAGIACGWCCGAGGHGDISMVVGNEVWASRLLIMQLSGPRTIVLVGGIGISSSGIMCDS